MKKQNSNPSAEATLVKGWWAAHHWLILRRLSQCTILGLFLLGPFAGIWIAIGNLNSSLILGILPMSDPYVLLQSLFARHTPEAAAFSGALVVIVLYVLVGGRTYCAWVCPMNVVTDIAHRLRTRLGFESGQRLSKTTRYWLLAMTLIVSAVTGTIIWEVLNPVSMLHRGLIYGMGAAWGLVLAVFIFDLVVSRRGWCGHLCPVGAFYGVLGRASVLRVSAAGRERCNDCMDCFRVCPEPQVLKLPVHGAANIHGPVILSPNCTNCGRCIDVCTKDVFRFATRFGPQSKAIEYFIKETQP